MADQEYITIDDINQKVLVNAIALINAEGGDLAEFNELVDRANNYYEDVAQQAHVDIDDILFPIPTLSLEFLNYYMAWKYASEARGQANNETTGIDTYGVIEEVTYRYYRDHLKHMTGQYISGDSTSTNRVGVTFGRMVRG